MPAVLSDSHLHTVFSLNMLLTCWYMSNYNIIYQRQQDLSVVRDLGVDRLVIWVFF